MHETVLKHEAVSALVQDANGFYVDGTFGRGGHTREILSLLGNSACVIGVDRDSAAEASAVSIEDKRFSFRRSSFSRLRELIEQEGLQGKLSGVLLDLGVSSPQLDDADRGFSFRFDGPLDMRMDTSSGISAAEWVATQTEDYIAEVLKVYGEERFARRIARRIVETRDEQPITTTVQLSDICGQCIPKRELGKNPATRTFQAIRIDVNQELEELKTVLSDVVSLLKPGGRLVVISFHSLEDRIVKRFMRKQSVPPSLPKSIPVQYEYVRMPLKVIGKPVFASEKEVAANPRARSAVMRIAERSTE